MTSTSRYENCRRAIAFVVSATLLGCSKQATQITLIVDAQPSLRTQTDTLTLEVLNASGQPVLTETLNVRDRTWPIRRVFVPASGDATRFLTASASARVNNSANALTTARLRVRFSAERNDEVRLLLLDGCIGLNCPSERTCSVDTGAPVCIALPVFSLDGGLDSGVDGGADGALDSPMDSADTQPDGMNSDVFTDGATDSNSTDVLDSNSFDSSAVDSNTADAQHDVGCVPSCGSRTCGSESTCGTSCGTCSAGTCNAQGQCEVVVQNGPRFLDPPTIAEAQPVAANATFMISMTVTDPQGLNTIALAEVRNPTGQTGVAGRYALLAQAGGSGVYSATVPWSAFSASNGGLPEDISGSTTRVLRVRIVDQDGNELLQDVMVRLGGCAEALCGGRCATCPAHTTARMCSAQACQATSCDSGYAGPSCADINECDTTPCAIGACQNLAGSYQCVPRWRLIQGTGPSVRASHAMAFDSANNRVVLYGGYNGTATLDDTWTFANDTWSHPNLTGPRARSDSGMAYDPVSRRVVLFGGTRASTGDLADTWVLANGSWTDVGATGPSSRARLNLAYDRTNTRMVLFGGAHSDILFGTTLYGDTWAFSGNAWTQVSATSALGERQLYAMSYDGANDRTTLFGGQSVNTLFADTWTLSREVWTQRSTIGPSPRGGAVTAYDTIGNRMVLFGGSNGTVRFNVLAGQHRLMGLRIAQGFPFDCMQFASAGTDQQSNAQGRIGSAGGGLCLGQR